MPRRSTYNPRVTTPSDTSRFRDLTIDAFLDRLASSDPVPGGGSAAAVVAALGAGLVTMVAALSTGRPRYAAHESVLGWAAQTGRLLSDRFLDLAQEDADAFSGFAAAMKLPRETDEQIADRTAAIQTAARQAAEIPMRCVQACVQLVVAAEALAGRSNANASSDLNVAALLGEAAARGAAANVLVNLPAMGDPETEGSLMVEVDGRLREIDSLVASVRQVVASGEPRDPVQPGILDVGPRGQADSSPVSG